jgi:dsDNA-specific endonuclease/ATPase MutS2
MKRDDTPGSGPEADRAGEPDALHRVPIEEALDLHAFSPRDIPSLVDEYITAAADAGLTEVRLIHGRGIGVQRAVVQRALDRHARVRDFYDAPDSHLGATIARLKAPERTEDQS